MGATRTFMDGFAHVLHCALHADHDSAGDNGVPDAHFFKIGQSGHRPNIGVV